MVPPSLGKIVIVEADMYRQKRVFLQPTHFVINTTFRFFFFWFFKCYMPDHHISQVCYQSSLHKPINHSLNHTKIEKSMCQTAMLYRYTGSQVTDFRCYLSDHIYIMHYIALPTTQSINHSINHSYDCM